MKKYSSMILRMSAESPRTYLSTSEHAALGLLKPLLIRRPSLPVVKVSEPLFRNARLFNEKNTRQKPSSTL